MNATVEYNLDVFDTNKDQQFEDDYANTLYSPLYYVFLIMIIGTGFYIMLKKDDYNYHSGFRGGGTHYHFYSGGSSRSSTRHCACACACAGGGRAGCSVKDFYKPRGNSKESSNDEVRILLKVLREESKR